MENQIRKIDLWKVFIRTHLMMSVWNFQRMLNIGFVFSLSPIIRVLGLDQEKSREFYQRHLNFYNSHPYFASVVLGIIIKKEEELLHASPEEQKAKIQAIDITKRGFMGPMGALGDSLVWESYRPMIGAGLILFILLAIPNTTLAYSGILVYFLLYNLLNEYIRFKGVFEGYQKGELIIKDIQALNIPRLNECLKDIGTFLTGGIIGVMGFTFYFYSTWMMPGYLLQAIVRVVVFTALVGICWFALKKQFSTTVIFLTGISIILIAEILRITGFYYGSGF
jgi:mannose/fructose/N-acetylgalactosamine-specific phosphotransferase system component IID